MKFQLFFSLGLTALIIFSFDQAFASGIQFGKVQRDSSGEFRVPILNNKINCSVKDQTSGAEQEVLITARPFSIQSVADGKQEIIYTGNFSPKKSLADGSVRTVDNEAQLNISTIGYDANHLVLNYDIYVHFLDGNGSISVGIKHDQADQQTIWKLENCSNFH